MTTPHVLLNDVQRLDWLRLVRSEGIGPRTFRALFDRHGGAAGALLALPDIARKSSRAIKIPSRADIEREYEAALRMGVRFVALGEQDYPMPLRAIDSAPPLLAVRGRAAVLAQPAIAIVGSRNASAAGRGFTERLARAFGNAGYVVASGLARGIDARAHEASLPTGTVAVLAGGHQRIYPPEHGKLLERGAAISEMPLDWSPRGRDFPRRNRLVSGMSLGVVVVEAARRSGSLITARFALEQGREVFAVPGSPLDPRSDGTNDLIRQGATLCADPDHVLEVLAPLREAPVLPNLFSDSARPRESGEPLWDELLLPDILPGVSPAPDMLSGGYVAGASGTWAASTPAERVVALLDPTPVSIDDLIRASGLGVREVQVILFDLEMDGRLERHGSQAVSLIPSRGE